MRLLVLIMLACLSACGWLGARRPAARPPTEIVITGAPLGSLVFIDGSQAGQSVAHSDQSEIFDVSPGPHQVDIHVSGKIVYREDTYVDPGERRIVTVLSGLSR